MLVIIICGLGSLLLHYHSFLLFYSLIGFLSHRLFSFTHFIGNVRSVLNGTLHSLKKMYFVVEIKLKCTNKMDISLYHNLKSMAIFNIKILALNTK